MQSPIFNLINFSKKLRYKYLKSKKRAPLPGALCPVSGPNFRLLLSFSAVDDLCRTVIKYSAAFCFINCQKEVLRKNYAFKI